jgi:3-dehydroquinate dehydratase
MTNAQWSAWLQATLGAYQQINGLPVSGALDSATIASLSVIIDASEAAPTRTSLALQDAATLAKIPFVTLLL